MKSVWIAWLALGCANGQRDGPSDQNGSTNPTTPSATTSPTSTTKTPEPEDCADGIDNDLDGLLDCEDGDCVGWPCEGEAPCDDDIDNDNDGHTDCEDDDCWGHGCTVSIATLASNGPLTLRTRNVYGSFIGQCSDSFQSILSMASASGTVRHMPASTPLWSTCSWHADKTSWSTSWRVAGNRVTRTGFYVEPGCALTSSTFLPQALDMGALISPWHLATRPSGLGSPWANFYLPGTIVDIGSSNISINTVNCWARAHSYFVISRFDFQSQGVGYTLTQP